MDRDGTIIFEPHDFQVDALDKINFVPDVIASLSQLIKKGYSIVMVTNQDGLGTDAFPSSHFEPYQSLMIRTLAGEGFVFDEIHIDSSFEKDNFIFFPNPTKTILRIECIKENHYVLNISSYLDKS